MSWIRKALIRWSGSSGMQALLEKYVLFAQFLMGIGSGSDVNSSGERAVFHALRACLPAPYCIFDVGANQGQFLHLLLEQFSAQSFNVHCFEPGQETFRLLSASAPAQNNIHLNPVGLSKEPGQATLYYDEQGSGFASLTQRKLDHFDIHFSQSETVALDSLDHYCEVNQIEHIDLLKIDIEGHELDALEGARRLFAAGAIEMVTFEFGGCNIDTRTYFQDFWYFFQAVGMQIFRITPSGYLSPLHAYDEAYEQFRTTNFLACKPNWAAQMIAKAGKE